MPDPSADFLGQLTNALMHRLVCEFGLTSGHYTSVISMLSDGKRQKYAVPVLKIYDRARDQVAELAARPDHLELKVRVSSATAPGQGYNRAYSFEYSDPGMLDKLDEHLLRLSCRTLTHSRRVPVA